MKNILSFLFVSLVLMGCEPASPAPIVATQEEALSSVEIRQIVNGFRLYHNETFDGNGRTCATCHMIPTFALSIDQVQHAPANSPLFRALDSDEFDGASYSLMESDGLVRVHVLLAPNVRVLSPAPDGLNVQLRPDGRYVVAFRRATPTSVNSGLNEFLMLDGREMNSLSRQALSAVHDHAEPGREPTQDELEDIAAFQRTLFSSPALAAYALDPNAAPPELPPGRTASEQRGREFFVSAPLSAAAGTHGLCATCHSGPMLNTTNQFNPGDPPGLRFTGNRTSEFNVRGLPTYTFEITAMEDLLNDNPNLGPPGIVRYPAGTVFTVTSPDPGVIVVDDPRDGIQDANGDGEPDGYATPCFSMAGCAIFDDPANPPALPNSGVAFHRVPTLWGIRHTAPYFHDNSADTLEDAARHYVQFFEPTRQSMLAQAAFFESTGDPQLAAIAAMLRDMAGALVITEQDVQDIAAYMRLL